MYEEKSSKEKQNLQYLKLNSNNKFELLSEKEYSKEINNLPKIFKDDIAIKEEKITKFLNNILPETKENDILKMNFSLSSGCKKNKEKAQQCLNDLMNMPEISNLILTKDVASKLSQIIKEIFRRMKKYSDVKTYDVLLQKAKDFIYKEGNIINKYMIEIDEDKFKDKYEKNNFNNSAKDLSKFNKILKPIKLVEFKFIDIKKEKKKSLPSEMRCLIKKFSIIKKLKLSLNNNNTSHTKTEEFSFDLIDIQNIIIILYNSEWLFQNLLEIEIDLSNNSLLQSSIDIQRKNLKKLSEILNKDIKLSLYYYGLDKNIIFNPYQLSNFYTSLTKNKNKDNFLVLYNKDNRKNILSYESYEIKDEDDNDDNDYKKGIDEFINDKKYFLQMIIVYAYSLIKLKNIRICHLIHPINYNDEVIQIFKKEKIIFEDFNLLGFFKENYVHHFTIDFNSLDSLSFQNILNFISQNGLIKIFRINFFKSEEYFKSEMLYKILQINEKKFQDILDNFHYDDENKYICDLKINESLDNYLLRKLYDKFQKNISYFFYLITMRIDITELSIIFDIPKILINNNSYITLIQKLILNLIAFINTPVSNLTILSIQAESLELNGKKCIYLEKFFDKLNLYNAPNNKVKSLTIQCQIYNIINIHKLIPFGIEYLSLGTFDLNTFIYLVNYLTSIEFSEHSKLKKLKIKLNNSIFKYEECKEYFEQLLIEHPRNLTQICIYTHLTINFFSLKNLLLKSNYNIIENIFLSFSKKSLKDDGYKEKLKSEDYNKDTIIIPNFLDLYYVQRKKKNTKMIIDLINILGNKINKSFNNYNIFLNIEKFVESMEQKKNLIEFK